MPPEVPAVPAGNAPVTPAGNAPVTPQPSWPAPVPPVPPVPRRAPRPLPADATSGGLAFHRLVFLRPRSGAWTPVLTGLLGVAFYVAMLTIGVVVIFVMALLDPAVSERLLSLDESVIFDLTDPVMLALLLATIVAMLPAYVLASRIVNGPRVGYISSVAGRLRWSWMLLCTGASALIAVVSTGLSFLLPSDGVGSGTVVAPDENPALWGTLAVLIIVVPLQAAAEEYIFRGYFMQAIGRWLRHPAFAILLPVPLFVLGHLYDPLGQAAVGIFAIAAGWLTWRTGGLEAAIALHVVNNLVAFLLSLAGQSDVNDSSPGWSSLLFSLVLIGAYTAVVEWLLRRRRLGRTVIVA